MFWVIIIGGLLLEWFIGQKRQPRRRNGQYWYKR